MAIIKITIKMLFNTKKKREKERGKQRVTENVSWYVL
jgi:hypothetical protein